MGGTIAAALFVLVLWALCGCPRPDPPTRDIKKRLKRQARRSLCYGEIAAMEREIYGKCWTNPRTGAVAVEPARFPWSQCDYSRCNVHHF